MASSHLLLSRAATLSLAMMPKASVGVPKISPSVPMKIGFKMQSPTRFHSSQTKLRLFLIIYTLIKKMEFLST
jgi:hypothetical protein